MKKVRLIKTTLASLMFLALPTSCAGLKGFMAVEEANERNKPISNPFGALYPSPTFDSAAPVVVRSKKGDRSVEVEIPAQNSEVSEWVVPVSPQGAGRGPASLEERVVQGEARDYGARKPSSVDREIQRQMPQSPAEQVLDRRELESDMGLQAVEEDLPRGDRSYLGSLDRIKALFRERRYEAALLEVEEMLKEQPTDPKLHSMRGTLLDRLGYSDLARQSWAQALKLDPTNEPLRRFMERKGERVPASSGVVGGRSL